MRRQTRLDGDVEPDVRGYAVTHPEGGAARTPYDASWSQLLYASEGVLSVVTPDGTWVVPPHRAVSVPAGVRHRLQLSGRTALRVLYVRAPHVLLPPPCRVVDVPPLLRELVLHAVRVAPLWLARPQHRRLVGVLRDQLQEARDAGLQLPLPRDPRARAAADLMSRDLAVPYDVQQLAGAAGASRRTLERIFLVETGMTVGQWRRRRRMLEALRLLAGGAPAGSVATRVGYSTQSAFGAAFRAELGTSPAQWSSS